MQNIGFKNVILLITAMVFLAGCDPYTSWGPECVYPLDNFKFATSVEVNATKKEWTNTNISLSDGDKIEIELISNQTTIPITLCGRHEYRTTASGTKEQISVAVNAINENWTPAPSDIPPLKKDDIVYVTIGKPNAAGGVQGNKLSHWGPLSGCDYPGSGGLSCGSGTGTGSLPWDDSKDVFSKENNACIQYPPPGGIRSETGKKCWNVYGNNASYRISPNSNTSPSGITTYPLTPTALEGADDITKVEESNRGLVVIDPVPNNGYLQFRANDQPGLYGDNLGGYTMIIKHYGCPRKNGEGLVAYIGEETPGSSTSPTWTSNFMTLNSTGDKYIKYTDSFPKGTLWLKIDDPDGDYTPASNEGVYRLSIKVRSNHCANPTTDNPNCNPDAPNNITSTVVEWVVDKVETTLRKAQRDLFEGLAGTSDNKVGSMVNFIRACLVLYVALYGAAFAFGLIQSPQYDFFIRMMKFIIVIQLLGPNAWNFFNTYFFSIFTDGTKYIIYILNNLFETRNIYGTGEVWASNVVSAWAASDQSVNFGFLDLTVGRFFEQKFWIQMLGLIFSGPFGWLYFLAIITGIVIFIKALFRAIMAYVISLIAMALLIGVSPLFLTFLLFSQTRDLFEAWIQQLVNYVLRPISIFTVLAIFNFLMWATLTRMMSYGVCWKCILNIKFDVDFLPTLCVMYFYQPIAFDDFGGPIATLMPISFFAIITFLILAYLLDKVVLFAESMISSLTSATSKADLFKPAAALANDMKRPIGMDAESIKRRKDAAEKTKRIAKFKNTIRQERWAAREQEDKRKSGRMESFDQQQKEKRTQELEHLGKMVKESPQGDVKQRAKDLEKKLGGKKPGGTTSDSGSSGNDGNNPGGSNGKE